ncbi:MULTISPECIES: hypothetical protein [Sphingomonadaceae]|nr:MULTISPECIES: hypothetical protein [Sphingomonadaceae]
MQHSVDFAAPGARRQDDALDEPAQGVGGLFALFGTDQGVCQALDLAAINLGDVGMDIRNISRRGS